MWSRQAWLQAMQGVIAWARPARALATKAASARNGRAIETMSAQPSASVASATSGVLMRLDATSGIETSPIIRLVSQVKAARGTEVAMVGTRASCQPMPVFRIEAPAASIALASRTTSSQVWPFGTRSIMREAVDQDEVVADRGADPPDRLDRQAHPVLERPAPAVGAPVGVGDEELVEEVALRAHHLDAVVAGLARPGCGGGDVGDLLFDPGLVEFARRIGRDRRADRRGGHAVGAVAVAAGVQDLHGDPPAGGVHGVGHLPVVRHVLRREQARRAGQHRALGVGGHAAGDDQRDLARRALGVEGGDPAPVAVLLEPGVHRAHQHPVRQGDVAEIERREQVRVECHGPPPGDVVNLPDRARSVTGAAASRGSGPETEGPRTHLSARGQIT